MLIGITSLLTLNPNLFSEMSLPDGVDRELLVDNIVLECAELEVLLADADFMQKAIGRWSKSMVDTWSILTSTFDATKAEMWDEDIRHYSRTVDGEGTKSGSTKSSTSGSDNTAESVAGFNSTTLVNSKKDTVSYGGVVDGENSEMTTSNNWESVDETVTHKRNIPDIVEKRRELAKFNIYRVIVEDFKNRFCLLIY